MKPKLLGKIPENPIDHYNNQDFKGIKFMVIGLMIANNVEILASIADFQFGSHISRVVDHGI